MTGYWIQKHDYNSQVVEEANLSQTLFAFQSFDWASEIKLSQEGIDGKDCSPGIGINNGIALDKPNGFLLHICPFSEHDAFFNFHYQKPKKLLGFISASNTEVHYVERFPISGIKDIIEKFFLKKYDDILAI